MNGNNSTQLPESVTGTPQLTAAARYGSKRDVALMIQMSLRSVDNLVAAGCPHLKIGQRRLRFDLAEVRTWLADNFRQQRRAAKGGAR